MSKKAVVLYSGGLDSTVMLHECVKELGKENVFPLYVNYGSKHCEQEFMAHVVNCKDLGLDKNHEHIVIVSQIFSNSALTGADQDVPSSLDDTIKVVVPFRNLSLATFGAMYADKIEANSSEVCEGTPQRYIYMSPTKEDYEVFRDCRRDFFDSLEVTLNFGAKYEVEYNVVTPNIYLSKGDIIKKGVDLGVDFTKTWTCYNPVNEKPCGTCPSCQVRAKGFEEAGIVDPLEISLIKS